MVKGLEVPAYFFMGQHDYTTNYGLAQEYFKRLRAPVKGFYTFAESAHSPLFEKPQRARKILKQDVLTRGVSLADAKLDSGAHDENTQSLAVDLGQGCR